MGWGSRNRGMRELTILAQDLSEKHVETELERVTVGRAAAYLGRISYHRNRGMLQDSAKVLQMFINIGWKNG